MKRITVITSILGLTTALVTALVSCAKSEKPTPDAPPTVASIASDQEPTLAKAPSEPQAQELAQASYAEANFLLKLAPVGTYTAKQPGEAQIVLEAKAGFKCNDKYPYKFKLGAADGLKFSSDVIRGDAIQVTKERSVMKLSFVPESAGKKRLNGTFFFSVCTDDKCLVERRDLALDLLVN